MVVTGKRLPLLRVSLHMCLMSSQEDAEGAPGCGPRWSRGLGLGAAAQKLVRSPLASRSCLSSHPFQSLGFLFIF